MVRAMPKSITMMRAVLFHHDVLRLQIAVYHAFGMRGVERGAGLVDHVGTFFKTQPPFFLDKRSQIFPLDKTPW